MNAVEKRLEKFRSSIPVNDNGENWLPLLKVITIKQIDNLLNDLEEMRLGFEGNLEEYQISMMGFPIQNIPFVPDIESLMGEVERLVGAIRNVKKMLDMPQRYDNNITVL